MEQRAEQNFFKGAERNKNWNRKDQVLQPWSYMNYFRSNNPLRRVKVANRSRIIRPVNKLASLDLLQD